MKTITVKDIANVIHNFAPRELAYDWDNVGFLLGDADQEVKKILLSLDVTENTVKKAIETGADLIVTHHPLIFKPVNKITNPLYIKLIKNNISVICAHTNLDITPGGVNHKLAEIFQLSDLEILSSKTGSEIFHIAVMVPQSDFNNVKDAVFSAGAGEIGNYSNCMNSYEVIGQFKPLKGSNPANGIHDELINIAELKMEFFVDSFNLNKVIKAMKKAHSYETPVYAVYPQHRNSDKYGLGLIGKLPESQTIQDFAQTVKNKLRAPSLKVWYANRSKDTVIKKIAVCGGSGSSLINYATGRADLYLAGEFGYHSTIDSRIPLIAAGHFHTEYPVLEVLKNLLKDHIENISILPFEEHEVNSNQEFF